MIEKKAVLFDLDGVLVDACAIHYQALNLTLQARGHDPIPMDKHLDYYNGLPTKTKLKLMCITGEEALVIEEQKQKATISLIESNVKRDSEKVKLLLDLHRTGYALGCVTNCSPKTAAMMLSKAGLLRHLNTVVTNADVQHPKPSPEGYQLAMTRLQVLSRNTWIVEDSPKGIMAAKATGAGVIAVNGPEEVTLRLLLRYLLK